MSLGRSAPSSSSLPGEHGATARRSSGAQGLAPSTVAKCYQVLGKIMAAAVDAGLLARSPCRAIRLPRVEREPPRFLTPAEVARLADAIDPRYRALVLVGAYGGLRIGELAGLTRRRVDLLRGTVEVAEIVTEVEGQLGSGLPKTRAGRRTVGLPRRVVAELEQHMAAYTAPAPTRTCSRRRLAGRSGRPGSAAGYGARHHRRRPGGPQGPRAAAHRRRALDRRRASPPKEVAARAGHIMSVSFTLDRYGGLFEGHDRELRDRLDAMYADAGEGQVLALDRGASGPIVVPDSS